MVSPLPKHPPLSELFAHPETIGSQLSILSLPKMAQNQRDEKPHSGSEPKPEPKPERPRRKRPLIHPSFMQVTKSYMFEKTVQDCHEAMGVDRARDEQLRLLGVSWIASVRKALHLYVGWS